METRSLGLSRSPWGRSWWGTPVCSCWWWMMFTEVRAWHESLSPQCPVRLTCFFTHGMKMLLLRTTVAILLVFASDAIAKVPYNVKYIEQKVDHFNFVVSATFKQRYLYTGKRSYVLDFVMCIGGWILLLKLILPRLLNSSWTLQSQIRKLGFHSQIRSGMMKDQCFSTPETRGPSQTSGTILVLSLKQLKSSML